MWNNVNSFAFTKSGFSDYQVSVICIKIIIHLYLFLGKCCRVPFCDNCIKITFLKICLSQSGTHIKCYFLLLLDSKLEDTSSFWSQHDSGHNIPTTDSPGISLRIKNSWDSSLDCDTYRHKNKSIRH